MNIHLLLCAVCFFTISGSVFANFCEKDEAIDYTEVYFEETIPNKFSVLRNGVTQSDVWAEYNNEGDSNFLSIIDLNKSKQCIVDRLEINPIKFCSNERWRLVKNYSGTGWSVVGENSFVMEGAKLEDALICGHVSVDSNSKIFSTVIQENIADKIFRLLIAGSTMRGSEITITRLPSGSQRNSSIFINSDIDNVVLKGSVEADSLSLGSVTYPFEGDFKCDNQRCYYKQNPCPEGRKLYSFVPLANPEPRDTTWFDSLNLSYPRSGFSCDYSIASVQEYLLKYNAGGGQPQEEVYSVDNLDSAWPSPNLEYVGCTYDGKISKSLYRYNSAPPEYNEIESGLFPTITTAICSESLNQNQEDYESRLAEMHRGTEIVEPGYVSLRGAPFCYKYRIFQVRGIQHRMVLSELQMKHEECSSCPAGMVKVQGACTCPEGYTLQEGSCKRSIGCETVQEYWGGKCECSKPYLYTDLNGRNFYSCSVPSRNYPFYKEGSKFTNEFLTVNIQRGTCRRRNNVITLPFTLTGMNNNAFGSRLDVLLTCSGKRGDVRNSSNGIGLGVVDAIFGQQTFIKNYNLAPVGDCYELKLRVIEPNLPERYYWEETFNLDYNDCKQAGK